MNATGTQRRIVLVVAVMLPLLLAAIFAGLSVGATDGGMQTVLGLLTRTETHNPTLDAIVWNLRLPRVLTAALAGAALSLGGLVFQAVLRNPLAEPYILGISGGSAIGAIIGILLGLSRFPGISFMAFAGSISTLAIILAIVSGGRLAKNDSLLLSGVITNAFCSAVILFLVSLAQDHRLHSIMFWLMGDLSATDMPQLLLLAWVVLPCCLLLFCLSHKMNALLLGRETAQTLGVSAQTVILGLIAATSFMVSATVCQCGLLGFVGLVMPHILRLLLGPDHRVLAPACVLGGAAYLIGCDVLARTISSQGEIPVGVITAMIGAPVFIILLRKSQQ